MKITIAPGDGIGPETMDVVLDVFRAAGVPLEYEQVPLGRAAALAGDPAGVGEAARASVERTGVLLKGPTEAVLGAGRSEPSIRRAWGAFAQKRIYRMLPGVPTPLGLRALNLTLVQEQGEEGTRLGEVMIGDGVAQLSRIATRSSALRVHRYAFDMAARKGAKRITCAHQADVIRLVDGLFLDAFYEVAEEYPDLRADDLPVDRLAMQLVTEPEAFEVLVLPDMPGEILSDLAAGLVGGLAYAPSASIGERVSVFEPVHGPSHPLVGRDRANPTALLLAGTMMLRQVGLGRHALTIERALERALYQIHRRPELRAYATEFRTSIFRYRMIAEVLAERSGAVAQPASESRPARRGKGMDAATRRSLAAQLEGLA